nr:MAG TPA: hypothetical protein [Caudoviricetes sp.]
MYSIISCRIAVFFFMNKLPLIRKIRTKFL